MMKTPLNTIKEALDDSKILFEELDSKTLLANVPGEKKLYTNVIFKVSDRTLSVNAFVIRKPDQNIETVYEWLLRHNANMYLLSYATNELGDIYLVGRLPIELVTNEQIDEILGTIHQYCDASFNTLLELGFADAIRREWAWRISRGESVANLEAFKHLQG
jgi:hypothetical protein